MHRQGLLIAITEAQQHNRRTDVILARLFSPKNFVVIQFASNCIIFFTQFWFLKTKSF